MKTVGAYEAKTHLSRLLDEVEEDEDITITRCGQPVARLLPAGETTSSDRGETVDALRSFREGRRLEGDDLRALIEEGRT